mgnify:CR=1 FL=1
MTDPVEREGGCLCGRIRYRITGEPFQTEYCHCRMCQRSVGSAVVNWMDFKAEQVEWLADEPKEYTSSKTVRRGFCPDCGASLNFRETRYPQFASLTMASLDDANAFAPTRHIYTESQLEWLVIEDDCPRFQREEGAEGGA